MGVIDSFKQSEQAVEVAKGAAMMAVGAVIGVVILSARVNRMEKKISELQKVAGMNAAVTLNLTHAVGQLTKASSEIQ